MITSSFGCCNFAAISVAISIINWRSAKMLDCSNLSQFLMVV